MELLNLFDEIKIENNTRLVKEDLEFLEESQRKFELSKVFHFKMKELIEIKKDFKYNTYYEDAEYDRGSDFNKNSLMENNYNLFIHEANEFILAIYYYFNNKYGCKLETSLYKDKHSSKYSAYNGKSIQESNESLKFYEELHFNDILDDIFEQLGGVGFENRVKEELKKYWKDKTIQYRDDKKKVICKGKKVTINDLMWFSAWGNGCEIEHASKEIMRNLLKVISYINYNEINKEFMGNWGHLCKYGTNVVNTFILNLEKTNNFKIYKNGRVDITFTSSKTALDFAKEFLSYEI